MTDTDKDKITMDDCMTLLGEALHRRLNGETDMPAYFAGLARKIALQVGGADEADKIERVWSQQQ